MEFQGIYYTKITYEGIQKMELTEALMKNSAKLCGREYQIVHAIIHKTFRFHKKSDWINNAQISEMTGIAQSKISELKKSLINKNILDT